MLGREIFLPEQHDVQGRLYHDKDSNDNTGICKGYIYARLTEGLYELHQSGRIAYDELVKHLDTYGCHPSINTPRLWTHKNQPINFTLVFDGFRVKYLTKYHALHLKAESEDKYKVTINSEGKLYIEIALKWDYEKGSVQLLMSRYVRAALHSFQHKKHKITQDSPYPWTQTIYGNNNQMLSEKGIRRKIG